MDREGNNMKLALNGATTMKADLVTDIGAASAAGFDYVEIWAAKLREYLKLHSTSQLAELLETNNIAPYSINSIERITFRDSEEFGQLVEECEELCRIAAEIGCPYIVVVPSPLPEDADTEEVIEESVRSLRDIAGIAQFHGVSLAFEFLGQKDCSVRTLALASEIVQQVDRPNVGLVLDSFHFYAGGSTIESIRALDPDRLFIFHINDAEDRPRAELEDRHRLFPGLGILPLRDITSALRDINYNRVASVEIFRPEYWERDPFEVASEAHKTAAKALELE